LEALACGAVVVASDIPVLREVGGDGAIHCPVGGISQWVNTIEKLLLDPSSAPDRTRRLAQAHRFSWDRHAQIILQAYRNIALRFAPSEIHRFALGA
jgi:glycosyltransferase involved in cell wall biosynthesis